MREFFGLSISLGALSQCEPRASEALKPASDEIEQEVVTSPVKHADATTWLLAGAIRSLWTYSTKTAVLYRIFENGQTSTIRPLFGTLTGILVSDRAPVFAFWSLKRRQICWSHLLRKFVAFTQRDGPASTWGETLLGYAKLIFEYWQAFCEGVLSRAEFQIWMNPVIQHTEHALGRVAQADLGSISGSCADILAHRQALWTFVTHEGVEPTNNVAERDLRAWVIWRKICFGCQSERGLRFAERIMTVTNTLRKRGRNVLDFLIRSVVAHTTQQPMPSLGS